MSAGAGDEPDSPNSDKLDEEIVDLSPVPVRTFLNNRRCIAQLHAHCNLKRDSLSYFSMNIIRISCNS